LIDAWGPAEKEKRFKKTVHGKPSS
jgi:hypothetical protein